MNPNNDALWQEAEPMLEKDKGLLVLDDRHWSGKHHDLVKGINLLS
jgi:hypothetical protein